jgi:hypothetical protein
MPHSNRGARSRRIFQVTVETSDKSWKQHYADEQMKLAVILLASSIAGLAQDGQIGRPKVYVTESDSWESSGSFSVSHGSGGGSFSGGARPQTVEVIKTFGQRCPSVAVTMDKSQADYIVLFDRDGGKGIARKRDKIAVFKRNGDVLYSGSTRSVGSAVQDACSTIENGGSQASQVSEPIRPPENVAAPPDPDQQPATPKFLHNADILALKQANFSDTVIIARIKSSLGLYELGTADLLKLKAAGVSEDVMAAMIAAPDHY